MLKERVVCPHCGAVQKGVSGVCDLCGSPLDSEAAVVEEQEMATGGAAASESAPELEEAVVSPGDGASRRGGFCTHCGAAYLEGARFCGSCGERLRAVAESARVESEPMRSAKSVPAPTIVAEKGPKPRRAATDKELGRQVLLVVGAAVILIVALFVITVVSRDSGSSPSLPEQSVPAVSAIPLSPEVESAVQSFRDEIEALTGEARVAKQRELVDFLISHGRWDLAGDVQAELAESTAEEADWIRAGNLYYDMMESVGAEDKAAFAGQAIDAYQHALQITPDNLDVRTDMAVAYMFDPENSVQAIAQTNMVLAEDSLHVQANFNRGIMLLRVNRFDEAAAQFEKVRRLVGDPENPISQRAASALDAIAQVRNQ